jgi:major capsid protein E
MPATDVPLETLYRTEALLDGLVQIPIAPTFLRDRLFGVVQTTDADLVSIEFYRGRQKLAPFCSRYSKGTATAREKTQLSLFSPPFVKPNRMLHADDLLRRNIGGSKNGGNASNRDAELLLIDQQELDASISRTENWMCSQVLFSGKVDCRDGDTGELTAQIDYGPISRTVTTKPWSDPTADPLTDLKFAQRLVSGSCGYAANFIVIGRLAGDAFESNAKVLESYNKLHIQPGVLTAEFEQFGVVLLGTWRGVNLYVSEEMCEDTDGTMKYYVPEKEVLVAATGIQSVMAYAGIAQASDGGMQVYEGRRIPLVYWDPSGEDYRRLRLSSRPVPIPGNVDSWTVLQVLA